MAHSDCGWTCGCAGKTVRSLENTCHTWALLRWWFTKRRYIKCMYVYPYLLPLLTVVGYDEPHTLVVLTEEELIAVDLQTDAWPCYQLPYLASLHCSAITCTAHCSNVPQTLWDKISDAGQRQLIGYSSRVGGACMLMTTNGSTTRLSTCSLA